MDVPEKPSRVITGTGFSGAQRKEIRSIVGRLGAEYLGELQKGCSTHLVLADAQQLSEGGNQSLKITRAQEWGIPVVTYDWLLDSASRGHFLDAQPYLLQGAKEADSSDDCWSMEKLRGCPSPVQWPLLSPGGVAGSTLDKPSPAPAKHQAADVKAPPEPDQDVQSHCSSQASFTSPEHSPAALDPSSDQLDELDALIAEMSGMSPKNGEERRPSAAACSAAAGSLQKCTASEATTALTAEGASAFLSTTGLPAPDEGGDADSPGQAWVKVGRALKTVPKGSTAAAFHGVPAARLTFYEELLVAQPGGASPPLRFRLRERSHCALVYYEDLEACPEADVHELAYADLLYCYTIKGAPSGEVWVEHGYLYDRPDLETHPMGRKFLEAHAMGPCELVETSAAYHSPASVIEGEFWLTSMKLAQSKGASGQHYWCENCWDRKTGACMPRGKRRGGGRPQQ